MCLTSLPLSENGRLLKSGMDIQEVKLTKSTDENLPSKDYKYGFYTDIETEDFPKGLNEDIIRRISAIKHEPEFLLNFRLKAFKFWEKMDEPSWPNLSYDKVDFQDIKYYAAPKKKEDGPKSLDEVDPDILATFERLGIPLSEQKGYLGLLSMQFLTVCLLLQLTKRNWLNMGLFSVVFPRL